jgi:site-specific recombinase XerD
MTNHTSYLPPSQQLEPIAHRSTEVARSIESAELLLAAFLKSKRSANTKAAYKIDVDQYLTYCHLERQGKRYSALEVDQTAVDAWTASLEAQGLSASTIARKISAVSGYYLFAQRKGAVGSNPTEYVERPSVSNESQTLGLDLNELRALIAAAEASSLRDRVLVGLLAQIGLRVSAACAANAEDLSLERGHNTITSYGKGGKILRRTLPPALYASILELLDGRTEGPILRRVRSGNALDRFDAAKIVSRLAREAGIEKRISPHSLRHTAVTLYLDSGAELRDVSDAMGHASPTTTMRYDRARRSLERDPAYKLEAALAG